MNRRDFLRQAAGCAVSMTVVGRAIATGKTAAVRADEGGAAQLKKSIIMSMIPQMDRIEDRFRLARDLGYEGLEVDPVADLAEARRMRAAAEKAGIRLHSVIYGGWQAPLSSPDPTVAEKGVQGVTRALESAKELDADGVLLVPAFVDQNTRYADAYERSQKHLRKLAPIAQKLKVDILVENVWNNFLLSPIEFARYIDEIKSPRVQAYFDVGNVVAFGWPEDWIRTLGSRIKKVHLKDFKRGPREFVNLRDGDVNWPEVRKAFSEVGYSGFVTAELGAGDEAYLRDVAARMDMIIGGKV